MIRLAVMASTSFFCAAGVWKHSDDVTHSVLIAAALWCLVLAIMVGADRLITGVIERGPKPGDRWGR